jgi:hypothetical protein
MNSNLFRMMLAVWLTCFYGDCAQAMEIKRGKISKFGAINVSSASDSCIVAGGLTSIDTVTRCGIAVKRVQYDIVNGGSEELSSWTLYYSPAIGPQIVSATVPTGYVDPANHFVQIGGKPIGVILNAGYGVYKYNKGAPWLIDYRKDHITFTADGAAAGLPPGCGIGFVPKVASLPSFGIEFKRGLYFGNVTATVVAGQRTLTNTVIGPVVSPPKTASKVSNWPR